MKHRRSIVGVVLSALVIAAALAVPPAPSAAVTQAAAAKRLLLLTHNTFYNHSSLADIERVVPEWGKTAGFSVTSLAGYKQTVRCTIAAPCPPDVVDLSMIDAEYLSQFDGIMVRNPDEVECRFRRKWNTDSGGSGISIPGSGTRNPGSGTSNPEEVEHRFLGS